MKDLKINTANMRQNLELTQGLVFSQRVLLALIEKGLTRQDAYKIVQRNAMQAWKQKTSFLDLLKADTDVTRIISNTELESVFNYEYFLNHVDTIFKRLGLTMTKKTRKQSKSTLAPQSI